MQLQQLAYFVWVARTRHFTRAADALGVAQPSLSKQIRALEVELGAPLFGRARGNITLTPAGEALVPIAERILADVESVRHEVNELAELRRGRVRLGATPSLCSGILADALRCFHDARPGIELFVEEGGSGDLVRDLVGGDLDIALVIEPLAAGTPLTTRPILHEGLVVVSRHDDPLLAGRSSMAVTDLRGCPLVMFRQGYTLRDTTVAACREAGFDPTFVVEGGEMDAVIGFVAAGLGVAVVPSTVVVGRAGLRSVPLVVDGSSGPRVLHRTVAVAHRTDVPLTRAAEAFRDTLRDFLVRASASGDLPVGVDVLPL